MGIVFKRDINAKTPKTCDKRVASTDLLSVVDVLSIDKYRGIEKTNRDYDKVRIVLNFDIKNNSKLYRIFRDLKNR